MQSFNRQFAARGPHGTAFPCERTFLLALILSASLASAAHAADGFVHGPRSTVGVFDTGDGRQIVEWIGPGSAEIEFPSIEPNKRTLIYLRAVPDGMKLVRQACEKTNVTAVTLRGVNLSDDDLNFLAEKCPHLMTLILQRPSQIPADELGDLTEPECSVLNSENPLGNALQIISKFNKLEILSLDGGELPSDRLKFAAEMKSLRNLGLRNMKVVDNDLSALSQLSNLELLDLSGTLVTGSTFGDLGGCRSLKHLMLERTGCTDSLSQYLSRHPWPLLKTVHVFGCNISESGTTALKECLLFSHVVTEPESREPLTPFLARNSHSKRLYRAACEILERLGSAEINAGKEPKRDHSEKTGPSFSIKKKDREIRFDLSGSVGLNPLKKVAVEVKVKSDGHSNDDWVLSHVALLGGLGSLSVTECKFSNAGFMVLVSLNALALMNLNLYKTSLDESSLEHLARFKMLSAVNLAGSNVTDACVEPLSRVPMLSCLALDKTAITDRGVEALLKMPSLRILTLRQCQITDEGIRHLAEYKDLDTLLLDDTGITDRGLEEIAKLPKLRFLSLNRCAISDGGVRKLLDAKNLQACELFGTDVSEEVRLQLISVCRANSVRVREIKQDEN